MQVGCTWYSRMLYPSKNTTSTKCGHEPYTIWYVRVPHTTSRIICSPPGYVDYDQGIATRMCISYFCNINDIVLIIYDTHYLYEITFYRVLDKSQDTNKSDKEIVSLSGDVDSSSRLLNS